MRRDQLCLPGWAGAWVPARYRPFFIRYSPSQGGISRPLREPEWLVSRRVARARFGRRGWSWWRGAGGYGTVGNTTINGGTLSPGNSIATLAAAANLVLTAASTYMVEVSPTASDLTHVTGSAALGGATVTAQFASGAYVGKRYAILTADGGVSGTFSGPHQPADHLQDRARA